MRDLNQCILESDCEWRRYFSQFIYLVLGFLEKLELDLVPSECLLRIYSSNITLLYKHNEWDKTSFPHSNTFLGM